MGADRNTIALAVKVAGRAAASREVQTLKGDVRQVGPAAEKTGAQTDRALEKVQGQVRRTGATAQSSFGKFRRSNQSAADTAERSGPKFRKAGAPLGTLARRAAGVGAAFLSINAANQAVGTVEELGSAAMGLAGNFGMAEEQAGRWAALAKVRGIAPKALNQSFGTLAKNVAAVGPAAEGQQAALAKLSEQQQKQLTDADNITNAQKREEKRSKILSSFQEKRASTSKASLGKQAEALKAFGISSSDAKSANKDMYGFLLKVADGYEKLGPGTDRSALAMSLFGRGWQTLRPIISKGSAGLKEQFEMVDQYGLNVADSTGTLAEHIAKQREQKIMMLGIQVQMGTVLLPLYSKGAELTLKLAKASNKAWPGIKKQIEPVVETVEEVVETTAKFVEKHPGLIRVAAGFVAVAAGVKLLKMGGQVTGINSVVKMLWKLRAQSAIAGGEGSIAGRRFVRGWSRQVGKPGAGAAAGAKLGTQTGAAAASSSSAALNKPGAITGRSTGRMTSIGRALGTAMGVAMGAYALNEFAHQTANAGVQDIWDKVRDGVGGKGAPGTKPFTSKAPLARSARRAQRRDRKSPDADLLAKREQLYAQVVATQSPAAMAALQEVDRQLAARRARRKKARGRARGGTVQPGETTLFGENGPELARFPAGTQIFPTSHPWTREAVSRGRDAGARPAAAARTEQRPVNHVVVYLGKKVIYEAVSDETEIQALRK